MWLHRGYTGEVWCKVGGYCEPVFDCLISKMTSPSPEDPPGPSAKEATTTRPSLRSSAREGISSVFVLRKDTLQLRRLAVSADSGRIGVLIQALNYPLSWARRRPLVKIPLLFVLKRRGTGCFGCLGCFGGRFAYVRLPVYSRRRTASGSVLIAAV